MVSGMENYLVGKKKMTLLAWGRGFPANFSWSNSPAPGEPFGELINPSSDRDLPSQALAVL